MTPAEIKALVEMLKAHEARYRRSSVMASNRARRNPTQRSIAALNAKRADDMAEAATALRSFMDGGWRLVSVEPTPEMIDAGKNAVGEARAYSANDRESARAIFASMIGSLPTPPAVEGEAGA